MTRYDFEDIVIEPVAYGPRIADKPRVGVPIGLAEIARAVEERRDLLSQCYRWARHARPALRGHLSVDLAFDVWGIADEVAVAAQMADGEALAGCVQDMLEGVAIDRYPARRARAVFPLVFALSGQRLPQSRPLRPLLDDEPSIPHDICLLAPARPEVDALAAPYPLLRVDDFSREQADLAAEEKRREAHRRALEQWVQDGEKGLAPTLSSPPRVVVGTPVHSGGLDKRYVLEPIRENLGAYRACYAAARSDASPGKVNVAGTIDEAGNVTASATSEQPADKPLADCLQRAIAEVWFPPLSGRLRQRSVEFNFAFRVARPGASTPPEPGAAPRDIDGLASAARQALDRGAARPAERRYAALLQRAPDDPRLCAWRLAILEARLLIAPWMDNSVMAAANALVDGAGRAAEPATQECLQRAQPTLTRLATEPHLRGQRLGLPGLVAVAATRYRWLVDNAPGLQDSAQLWFYLGEALWTLKRYPEAARAYAQVIDLGAGGRHFKEAEEGLVYCRAQLQRLAQGGALFP